MILAVITMLMSTSDLLFAICLIKKLNLPVEHYFLYNNQINVHALIGQSAVGYCAGKPTEKSRVFWIII